MKPLSHAEFKAEMNTDDKGTLITITQTEGYFEPMEVSLHPWQLRAILNHFSVLGADKEAEKKIAELERRMGMVRDRINTLHDYLCNNSDHRHADLTWEVTYATATLDLADEYCHDLDSALIEAVEASGQKVTVAP
ncbi:hypothetical protein DIC66_03700 [Rhodoferax lacus]|uniref:Uncharacterized protein n=1 Tax=Rhodoferax lacus TaxID=2184758 RepID=A0A3E1REZ9_9BURK|nr:hypothetical protein [Rhodoferax lacus]RFO97843.1 hypothetical protein DIC66_03700 [Rhodoferax lacus]